MYDPHPTRAEKNARRAAFRGRSGDEDILTTMRQSTTWETPWTDADVEALMAEEEELEAYTHEHAPYQGRRVMP